MQHRASFGRGPSGYVESMSVHNDDPTASRSAAEQTVPAATPAPPTVVVQPTERTTKKFRLGSFLAGFVTALVLAALAIVVFLVVSDSDDDGNIQLDVPAVEVDTGG